MRRGIEMTGKTEMSGNIDEKRDRGEERQMKNANL